MTEWESLAARMFPHITKTPQDYENLYPPRDLPEGARVTRLLHKRYFLFPPGGHRQKA